MSRRSSASVWKEMLKKVGTGLRMTCPMDEEMISLAKEALRCLCKTFTPKSICSSWLNGGSRGMTDLIEHEKAKRCKHPDDPAECPEQGWVGAVEDQPGKIRTNCKRYAPRETRNSHVPSAHIFGGKARHERLLERRNDHFADRDDDHGNHKEGKGRDKPIHGKTNCIQ